MESLKQKTISGFLWQLCQKVTSQMMTFVISVILARLLMPEDYGVVALASMFITLLYTFCDGGISSSLVQKKDADKLDYDTVFISSFVIGVVLYIILFFTAPFIASSFDNKQVVSVLRVLGLTMPLGAFGCVQGAYLSKQMAFKKLFLSSTIGSFVSAIVGLGMAYGGFGIWALIGQNLSSLITSSFVLFVICEWHPSLSFSWRRFEGLFSYGSKLMTASLLGTFFGQLKGYLIGLKFTPADLAFNNRGESLPGIVFNNIDNTVNSVLFPALCQLQSDKETLKRALSRSMQCTSFFLMPLLLGLGAISDKLIILIYTEKWASAIPYMRLVCLMLCFGTMGNMNMQALKALGKADTILKLEIYKKPVLILIMVVCMFISPFMIAVGQFIYSLYALVWNSFPNKKYLGYSLMEQLKDIAPNFIISLAMSICVYGIGNLPLNVYFILFIQVFSGVIIYYILSMFFNNDNLRYGTELIKNKLLRNYEQ